MNSLHRQSNSKPTDVSNDGIYVSTALLLDQRHRPLRLHDATRVTNATGRPGDAPSKRRGQGIEFEQIRPYQPTDEIRHIDWRATARTGKPFTRQYIEEHEKTVFIAVDQRVGMFFGSASYFKSYVAAVLAARLGWTAVTDASRLGAIVMSDRFQSIAVARPQPTMLQLVKAIVEANRALTATGNSPLSLTQLLQQTFSMAKAASTVYIVSDFNDINDDSAAILRAFSKNSEVTLLWVVDPLEQSLPPERVVGISNGDTHNQIRLDQSTRDRFRSERETFADNLRNYAATAAVTLIKADTDGDSLSLRL